MGNSHNPTLTEAEELRQAEADASFERALSSRFSLLKISERRYMVVGRISHSIIAHGVQDIIHLRSETRPLPYDDALTALVQLRAQFEPRTPKPLAEIL